jgi:cytochrome c oxidase assembly protein subunit 15
MGLVCASAFLLVRVLEPDGAPIPVVRRELLLVSRVLAAVTVVVLTLGTLVTGSGPHSGDAVAPARFGFDPRALSWLHSDSVLIWFGLLGMLLVGLRLTSAPPRPARAAWATFLVGLLQGLIGYVQYLTGLPVVAVALHMLGATLLVVAVTLLQLSLRERSPA